jgi:Uma2 family endonuclease
MDIDEPRLLVRHPWVARRKLTIADYYRMAEAGILSDTDRVELIEGELVEMVPIGSNHHGAVNALNYMLLKAVDDRAVVSVQGPVRLDDYNEPEPDFALLKPRADFYRAAHPRPEDVLLIIEVAYSSLTYDRTVKRALYARHGIPELWIVNIAAGEIEVSRDPTGDAYTTTTLVGADGRLEPAGLPGVIISAAAVLG